MKTTNINITNTRVIFAPPPTNPSLFTSIYSITLKEELDVEWQWLGLPDGNRVVINYKIVDRQTRQT